MFKHGPHQHALTLSGDLWDAVRRCFYSWDRKSPLDDPKATMDIYDELARAIIALARTSPDLPGSLGEDRAVESLRKALMHIEWMGEIRRDTLSDIKHESRVMEDDDLDDDQKAEFAKSVNTGREKAAKLGVHLPSADEIP